MGEDRVLRGKLEYPNTPLHFALSAFCPEKASLTFLGGELGFCAWYGDRRGWCQPLANLILWIGGEGVRVCTAVVFLILSAHTNSPVDFL